MVSKRAHIIKKALEILEKNPNGVRYADLVKALREAFPNFNPGTIAANVCRLDKLRPKDVYRPERGVLRLTKFMGTEIKEVEFSKKVDEGEFYKPFAEWLVNELEEATKAIPLGGNLFKDKWGTPDVIGIRESKKSDIIKVPTEVISAEIKIDSNNLITAFGQACAYKLFSHKVYLVVPKQSSETDISRLDSLCLIFGIGLVLFDVDHPEDPKFEIRVRARKDEPDIFYTNRYLKMIEDMLF